MTFDEINAVENFVIHTIFLTPLAPLQNGEGSPQPRYVFPTTLSVAGGGKNEYS